jgi:protein ImuA
MIQAVSKSDMIEKLKREIRFLEGYLPCSDDQYIDFGLEMINHAFPNHSFPTGAVHEFISHTHEDKAATTGFMSGIIGKLMGNTGTCLWISTRRTIFPPALKLFGIEPDRVIFIDLNQPKDAIWAVEEALKCRALAAVVGELNEVSFTESRRLQLAVEKSRVTGFLHRHKTGSINTLACVSRWKITPIESQLDGDMPGVGWPRWLVQLQKIRNGQPGEWLLEFQNGRFRSAASPTSHTWQSLMDTA